MAKHCCICLFSVFLDMSLSVNNLQEELISIVKGLENPELLRSMILLLKDETNSVTKENYIKSVLAAHGSIAHGAGKSHAEMLNKYSKP